MVVGNHVRDRFNLKYELFILNMGEADKVRRGQKHFQALGVPFSVAVRADEV